VSATLPAVAVTPGYEGPTFSLEVQPPEGGPYVPLKPDYMSLVQSISVHQVWDGADELTIEMVAWDEFKADFAVLGEEILAPGNSIKVRAGYGKADHIVGRFDIVQHNPSFPAGDPPKVIITAFDGFHLLMDNSWPGDYGGRSKRDRRGGGIKTYTDVMIIMARKYGFGLVADRSIDIPFRTKKVRVRKRAARVVVEDGRLVTKRVVLKDASGKPIYKTKTKKSRVVKNAGETDAKMVKDMAGYAGFLSPKIRYVEKLPPAVIAKYAHVEGTTDNDVLFFEAPNLQRQQSRVGAFNLVYSRRDDRATTLSNFEPQLSTKEIPTAVRVHGVLRVPVGKKGKKRKRVVTVEAEITEPEQLRKRANLLRRAARETNPTKKAELQAEADRIGSRITVSKTTRKLRGKRDKKRYKGTAGSALIDILGKDRKPAKEYDHAKKRKVQTMRREVVGATIVANNDGELEAIARGWLMARLSLYITASGDLENVAGSHTLYPNQVHAARGLPWEYEGPYMIRECRHMWTPQTGHAVSFEVQKVAEAPPLTTTGAKA
jgi:hypothetical protein